MFALGWLAVELAARDGDQRLAPLYIGLIGLSRAVPSLTISLLAGAVVDRTDRRGLMLRTQGAGIVLTAALAALTIAGLVSVGMVMLFSFLLGVTTAFDGPARQSMLPRLVPPSDIMSAVGLQSMAAHGTGIIGPALGGLLIAPFGAGGPLLANAIGHLPVLIALWMLRPMPPAPEATARGVLRSMTEGLAYLLRDPVVRWVLIIGASASLFARPYLNLLPAFVAGHLALGPGALSLILSVTGVGALAGAMLVASVGRVRHRGRILMGAAVATGALVSILGAQRDLLGATIVSFFAGLAVLVLMGVVSTILQTTTPDHLLGRVMAIQVTLWMGLMPLGQLALGSIGSIVGVERAFVAGGAAAAGVALLAAVRGARLRDLEARPRPAPEVALGAAVSPAE